MDAHINGKQGCPKCNQSHLERDMMQLLEKHNIKYEYQKRFKWLGKQSLDFYLPDYNVAIECQGIQHFQEVGFFNSISFEKRVELDNLKYNKCINNNVKLLYYTKEKIPEWIQYQELYFNDINKIFESIKNCNYE